MSSASHHAVAPMPAVPARYAQQFSGGITEVSHVPTSKNQAASCGENAASCRESREIKLSLPFQNAKNREKMKWLRAIYGSAQQRQGLYNLAKTEKGSESLERLLVSETSTSDFLALFLRCFFEGYVQNVVTDPGFYANEHVANLVLLALRLVGPRGQPLVHRSFLRPLLQPDPHHQNPSLLLDEDLGSSSLRSLAQNENSCRVLVAILETFNTVKTRELSAQLREYITSLRIYGGKSVGHDLDLSVEVDEETLELERILEEMEKLLLELLENY
jgi:hypothetical protein